MRLTPYRTRRQCPDRHPPHGHRTCPVLLIIVLTTRVMTAILLIDIKLVVSYLLSYSSHRRSSCFWQSESCANNVKKIANILLIASYSLS